MARKRLHDQYLTNLSECRQRLQGVRLRDLEAVCGVTHQHLWNIRQGRQQPSHQVLDDVLAGLDKLDAAEAEAQ